MRVNLQEVSAMPVAAPTFRTTAPMRLRIVELRLCGCSFTEIARRTCKSRPTVTKVVRRSPESQEIRDELKARLIGESYDWIESINFAVRNELDGSLAYRLLKAHGVIPDVAQTPAGSSRRKSRA
jgi:hypothetical protein